jgi:hypothetical protein
VSLVGVTVIIGFGHSGRIHVIGKPTESSFDDSPDLKTRILGEMRRQGVEESIREFVQESYEAALVDLNLGSLPVLSHAERRRLRLLVQNDILRGMIVKD